MFGFLGGESRETVARKKSYMKDAQRKWPFLTTFDCSLIKTEGQLSSIIHVRSGVSDEEAKSDVDAWLKNKQF